MALRISVVTPSLNQGRFIERTLRSVLAQTRPVDEYVVFDGRSTDETISILKRHPVRWVSEQDAGQADAINKGIAATTGEIIGWLNSDDVYYPGTLAAVERTFEQHPDVDVVYGAADHIDVDDRIIARYSTEPWNLSRLAQRCYLCQPAVFFRRSVVDRWGKLNPRLHYCMDYEYWLRLGLGGARVFYLPVVLAGSRLHPETKTLGQRTKVHAEILDMLKMRLGKAPAKWLYGYSREVAREWPPAKNSVFVRAIAILAISFHSAFRWNGYPRLDMLWVLARDLPRIALERAGRRLVAVGKLRQTAPRSLALPKSHSIKFERNQLLPSISIVTPSLNQHQFIERTIKSILEQGYPHLDYVVQDGGSTKATIEVLERYQSTSLRWYSEPDSGQSNALNRGFRRTTGDIMAWLNSDDVLLPGALQYVGSFFARHANVDVIYSHRIIIDENDQEVGRWILPSHDCEVTKWADYVPQETLFWRRQVWERIGGEIDESFEFAMDWDMILRFQRVGARFKRVPRFLAAFRAHPDQKTNARMLDLGTREMARLLERSHGRAVTSREGLPVMAPYLVKHIVLQTLHRAGVAYRR